MVTTGTAHFNWTLVQVRRHAGVAHHNNLPRKRAQSVFSPPWEGAGKEGRIRCLRSRWGGESVREPPRRLAPPLLGEVRREGKQTDARTEAGVCSGASPFAYDSSVLTELDVLKDVCARLDRTGIAYMLTGSMAMNYYAQPRMTRDIDLVIAVEPHDADRLATAFEPDYYVPRDQLRQSIGIRGMFNLLHLDSVVKVDMVVRKDEPYRHAEFERRQRVRLPGFDAWIVSKEDLILSKLVWGMDSGSELQRRDVGNLLSSGAEPRIHPRMGRASERNRTARTCLE